MTSLLGPLMAVRNWGLGQASALVEALRRPRTLRRRAAAHDGRRAFWAFPTAVLLMSFLAFFIGTFLQLLWEDLPITEPL